MSQRLQIVDSGRAQPPAAMGAILYSTLGNKKICVLGGRFPRALQLYVHTYNLYSAKNRENESEALC